MIHVYDIGNEDFDKNGDVILETDSGKVREAEAANYDLNCTVQMDRAGKWKHLTAEAVIKARVAAETIRNAMTGLEADVYVTTVSAALRSEPNEPAQITYQAWAAGTSYAVGAKVTSGNKNYQLTEVLTGNEIYTNPAASAKWTQIARWTNGAPVLVELPAGTELYLLEETNAYWYKMSTLYGLEGYIKIGQVQFEKHVTPEETGPREIRDQLFRIKNVSRNEEKQTITVQARHVSYDLSAVLLDALKIKKKGIAETLMLIRQAMMQVYRGVIGTDIGDTGDVTYSGEISGKNGTYALLDPDKGVVKCFDAMLRRDNWDIFILQKTDVDRGFRVTYGNNARGITWTEKTDGMILRVVPVAKAADGSELYLDPVKWVDSANYDAWPVKYMERLKVNGQVGKDDGSETGTSWTEETLREYMEKQARNRFDVDHADEPALEITLDFTMLGDTAEFPWLRDLQRVNMYDKVMARNARTGLEVAVNVSEIEYDINEPGRITGLKLSNAKRYNVQNVSGYNVMANSITLDKLTDEVANLLN